MENNDGVKLVGELKLRGFDEDGNTLWEQVYKNLVVNGGKDNLAKLLGGSGAVASKMGVGTSGTAAAVTDTALTATTYSNNLTGHTFGTNAVTFSYLFTTSEANGITIREMGLLTSGNVLLARKVLDNPIVKNNTFGIDGTWTITVL